MSCWISRASACSLQRQQALVRSTPSAALAARMDKEGDDSKRLELLRLTLLNRPITEREQREAVNFLSEDGENAWAELCHALLASNEFLVRM